jgi:hypothetical protein
VSPHTFWQTFESFRRANGLLGGGKDDPHGFAVFVRGLVLPPTNDGSSCDSSSGRCIKAGFKVPNCWYVYVTLGGKPTGSGGVTKTVRSL